MARRKKKSGPRASGLGPPKKKAGSKQAKPVKAKAKAKAKATPVKAKAKAKPKKNAKPAKTPAVAKKKKKKADNAKWIRFVQEHGVVLASATGPVPSVAAAVAGEPIVGSWWGHTKGQAIFEALSTIGDSPDVRSFRLVDHKITFVHRRLWPALARLAHSGVLDPTRVSSVEQEHMPNGQHRNFESPFPEWVPDDAAQKAQSMTDEDARVQLGGWLD